MLSCNFQKVFSQVKTLEKFSQAETCLKNFTQNYLTLNQEITFGFQDQVIFWLNFILKRGEKFAP